MKNSKSDYKETVSEIEQTLIYDSSKKLKQIIKEFKRQGQTIGFVPTMGSLHFGHESLIKEARKSCDKIVVSIFVNPAQFGANEDFAKYPRDLEKDKDLCSKNAVNIIFVPSSEEIYPDKSSFTIVSPPDSYKSKLCGITRKGHFDGVATVVLKLFNIVQPDKAYFGWKDAQQLIIINKMCKDFNFDLEVIGCPIVREQSGLAYSSRNAYLDEDSKVKASSIYKVLQEIKTIYENSNKCLVEEIFSNALSKLDKDIELEYLQACDVQTLEPLNKLKKNTVIAIAAKVQNVRLIDNILI